MAGNRYYLLDLSGGNLSRLQTVLDRLASKPGVRTTAYQRGHARLRPDRLLAIVQGFCEDADITFMSAQSWATFLGLFDEATGTPEQAVVDYLATNAAAWKGP